MILLVKIFSLLLGLTVVSKTYHDFKKGQENLTMFLFWTLAWIIIIAISLFPEVVEDLISLSRGQRIGTGTFLGMSIVFLFFVIYRVYIKADRVEKVLTKVIRQIALEKNKDRKKSK